MRSARPGHGIAKVDFFTGTMLLGTATTAPIKVTLNNLSSGTYSVVAKASDALDARTYSQPVMVTVK